MRGQQLPMQGGVAARTSFGREAPDKTRHHHRGICVKKEKPFETVETVECNTTRTINQTDISSFPMLRFQKSSRQILPNNLVAATAGGRTTGRCSAYAANAQSLKSTPSPSFVSAATCCCKSCMEFPKATVSRPRSVSEGCCIILYLIEFRSISRVYSSCVGSY